jgi:aryl-alcohol dehydrogenase-like predicted oxidoreductase
MKTRPLGSHGPAISVIGFGAWEAGGMAWGPNPPDDQTIQAMTTAIDDGVNWIDTAEVYGGGRSEELVGKAIKGRDVLIFTKLAPKPSGSGFDRAGVRAGAEASLKRLEVDTIDLYQLHWTDEATPLEETWEAMTALVDEGLVRHIGVSNFSRDQIETCERIRHVDSLQPNFSMLYRDARDGLLGFCADNGTGVIAYGPLAFGLLTGAITKDTEFGEDDWRGGGHGMRMYPVMFAPGKLEKNLEFVESLKPIADRLDITVAQLALAWVFHQRGVTGAIAGSRSPKHVSENAQAGDVELDSKDLEEIEELLP